LLALTFSSLCCCYFWKQLVNCGFKCLLEHNY